MKTLKETAQADLDVLEAMKTIVPTCDADVHLIWNGHHKRWSVQFWSEPTTENATASQVRAFADTPQGAMWKALKKCKEPANV